MPAKRSLPELVCDVGVLGFALFTLGSHVVVAAGGSLHQLVGLFTAAALGLAAARAGRGSRGAERRPPPTVGAPEDGALTFRSWGLGLAAVGTGASLLGGPLVFFGCAVALLATTAVWVGRHAPEPPEPPADGPLANASLVGLSAICIGVALATHRPDVDDAFYVNVAAAIADAPGAAVLAGDTLHGLRGLPLHLPSYALHSYEVAIGAVAWLLGVPAIGVFHLGATAVGGALVPLAHAHLFRVLTPRSWVWTLAALVVVLVAAGETHRWYANFGLVRLWQGKALALFVVLPLIYSYALRFAVSPSLRGFVYLAAAQIAAVGMSSTCVWLAPASALAAVAAGIAPNRAGVRTLATGALASLYPLAAGLLVRADLQAIAAPQLTETLAGVELWGAVATVFGDGPLRALSIFSILGAWACAPPGLARRFAAIVPLAVVAVLLDPWAADWLRANVTGPSYWRALWALPVPILLALVLTAPLRLPFPRLAAVPGAARAATGVAIAVFALAVPRFSVVSARNGGGQDVGIRIGLPGLKVPHPEFEVAERLHRSVSPGSSVLAPREVSVWLPTFQSRSYPLWVRGAYLSTYVERIGARRVALRRVASEFVEGSPLGAAAPALFAQSLEAFDVLAVCVAESPNADSAREILRRDGFRRTDAYAGYEIWLRE